MYTSQQASYTRLPNSTRSRRVSGNYARASLQQADYGHTDDAKRVSVATNGVTFQAWARSQYQNSAQQLTTTTTTTTSNNNGITTAPAVFQAQYQQPSGRSSNDIKFAVADYFDPYKHTARGQTLKVEEAPTTETAYRDATPRNIPRQPAAPPSPVMRAVRHSRPTTPGAYGQTREGSAEFGAPTRLKPRSHTTADDSAQTKEAGALHEVSPPPRVTSMYSTAAVQRPRPTSQLANAAIRDFVDMRASIQKKPTPRPVAQPWPSASTPEPAAVPASVVAPAAGAERSQLIEFIERQRARTTVQSTLPTKTVPTAPTSGSSESLASERSFKRSTARLAEVDPMLHRPPAPSVYTPSNFAPVTTNSSLPPSTRIVPRSRAQTVDLHTETSDTECWAIAHGRVTNRREARLARGSGDQLSTAHTYIRPERTAGAVTRPSATEQPPPPAITEREISVQTDTRPYINRGMQTAPTAIHSDAAVLDLMRQMDTLRQGHSNQISEYQEQVIDLELTNQDLSTEIDQLTDRLETREAVHTRAMDDLRQRLDQANSRVDRELADIKQMHAQKCDELSEQNSMLLHRCETYRRRLEQLGIDEAEILTLSAQPSSATSSLPIADQAFIETQFIETRESRQEADYFRRLMDIEQSMENTTIALGFELRRTQARFLQQAADFVREQLTRLQPPPEIILEQRRAAELPRVSSPPTVCRSPVQSLAAELALMSAPINDHIDDQPPTELSDSAVASCSEADVAAPGSPRRTIRSPRAAVSGLFSSSQESMATAVASAELAISASSIAPSITPPTRVAPAVKGASLGYFSARGTSALPPIDTSPKPSTLHWPPRSPGCSADAMTAEELLEALKLPPAIVPTRSHASSTASSPTSCRVPRTGSFSDLNRSFPSVPRSALPDDFASTLPLKAGFTQQSNTRSTFNANAEYNICLGLEQSSSVNEHSSLGSASGSRRFRRPNRRRSRSVGAWDRH
ncbi:hypothetical protein COEREDRAFT_82034 [Coemansia reversa NRRL 1564]|uniref:Uncharacterized protein n=1 Tax=Coemansia reversa (strain ATCC 12441 / NRRL 1564) TaxID=763665 RepID=A0A2G5B905_COERN|nr:hypothetical protein COEREDRAFT_82034 [Coemansia reversa NRRL 1564]|eukprot:PIA15495.1 hypothetical protein COEREDRAFT_82034 [Coemansia reversa NRRL 1564]